MCGVGVQEQVGGALVCRSRWLGGLCMASDVWGPGSRGEAGARQAVPPKTARLRMCMPSARSTKGDGLVLALGHGLHRADQRSAANSRAACTPASQVWCGVVPAGPSGQPLNSSYQNRDNAAYRWVQEWIDARRNERQALIALQSDPRGMPGAAGNGGAMWQRLFVFHPPHVTFIKKQLLFVGALPLLGRNDLGMALVNFCRIIPDGLLVFFPSYALLQAGCCMRSVPVCQRAVAPLHASACLVHTNIGTIGRMPACLHHRLHGPPQPDHPPCAPAVRAASPRGSSSPARAALLSGSALPSKSLAPFVAGCAAVLPGEEACCPSPPSVKPPGRLVSPHQAQPPQSHRSDPPTLHALPHRTKQPVVEPRESAAFTAAAEDFRNKLTNPAYNGAIFFAVTR